MGRIAWSNGRQILALAGALIRIVCTGHGCGFFFTAIQLCVLQPVEPLRFLVCPGQIAAQDEKQKSRIPVVQTEILQLFGVQPNESSIRNYLQGLIPSSDIDERIVPLVEQLSHDSFDVREKATDQLKHFPGLSQDSIHRQALLASKPETRVRLDAVLQWLEQPDTIRVQFLIFQKIESLPIENLCHEIVAAAPHIASHEYLQRAAGRALAATAISSDVTFLMQVLDNPGSGEWLRIGALQALMRIEPDVMAIRLPLLARNMNGNPGIEVARHLASINDARCFDLLIRLTGDDNRSVATQAWSALRGMTATTVPLNLLLDPATRPDSVIQLSDHIANNRNKITFEWNRNRNKLGRSLIADYERGIVREFNAAGQETWNYKSNNAFACLGLSNGHRLITSYAEAELLEFDETGQLQNTIKLLHGSPSSIVRLDNGNTLVSSAGGNTPVIEYSPEGISVQKFRIDDYATAVEMLENGNLLVALFNKNEIAEIDALGNTVWRLALSDQPYHASKLDNGNLLVTFCNIKVIREYTMDGDIVWSHNTDAKPFRAQRLDDGSTVIAGRKGIVFVAADGTETQLIDGADFGETLYFSYF